VQPPFAAGILAPRRTAIQRPISTRMAIAGNNMPTSEAVIPPDSNCPFSA
jgi:hypothetical protein